MWGSSRVRPRKGAVHFIVMLSSWFYYTLYVFHIWKGCCLSVLLLRELKDSCKHLCEVVDKSALAVLYNLITHQETFRCHNYS